MNQLRLDTQEDYELVLLKYTIKQGWTFRADLTVEDGLVLKGARIVIPQKKHEAALNLIHEGHLGLNKCNLHAKDNVYWLELNEQLEILVLNCELCLKC